MSPLIVLGLVLSVLLLGLLIRQELARVKHGDNLTRARWEKPLLLAVLAGFWVCVLITLAQLALQ